MKKINKRPSYLSVDDYLEIKIREVKLRNKEWKKQQRESDKKFKQRMDHIEQLIEKSKDNHFKRMALFNAKCNCEDHRLPSFAKSPGRHIGRVSLFRSM